MRRRCASSSLALLLEPRQPLLQLLLDPHDRLLQALVPGDVVSGRPHGEVVEHGEDLAGDGIDAREALDLVAEQLDAHGAVLVRGVHLDGVAPHPEVAAHQVLVVAVVTDVDELAQDGPLVDLLAGLEQQQVLGVLLRRAQAVDAATPTRRR